MLLGDFLNKMAGKLGLQNNSELVDFLSNSELANAEIGDGFATNIDTGLMSLAGAKQHPEVQKHFRAETLNTVDEQLRPIFSKYGLDADFAAERSSYKKIGILEEKLAAKIAEAESKIGSGAGGAEVEKLKKDLLTLQSQLSSVTASKDKELADLRAANTQAQLDMLVNFELNGKRYANADLGDTNVEIARAILNKALKEQNAILVNENGHIAIKQAGNTTLSLLDQSNNPVQFSDFTNKLLADKHLLEVTTADPPQHQPQHQVTVDIQPPTGANTARFDSAYAQSLADLTD